MDKSIKKKLKIVLVAFIIIAIPIGYFMITSIKLDKANEAYEEAMIYDDNKIDLAIQEIDNALRFVFGESNLTNQKAQLLYKKKEYRKILDCIENTKAYLYKGLIYEHLNNSDSAKIYYKKEIPKLKQQLKDYENDENLLFQVERQIALIYTFIGEQEKAIKYLKKIPNNFDFNQKRIIQQYDFYIENYKSGGYKDFLEGETVFYGVDSLSKSVDIDSLFEWNRFYYNGYTGSDDRCIYEIKKIFEQQAISSGLNKIDEKTKPNRVGG